MDKICSYNAIKGHLSELKESTFLTIVLLTHLYTFKEMHIVMMSNKKKKYFTTTFLFTSYFNNLVSCFNKVHLSDVLTNTLNHIKY